MLIQRLSTVLLAVFVAAAAVTSSAPAAALPRVGSPRPDVILTDGWDRTDHLGRFARMPVLVVYEDKG